MVVLFSSYRRQNWGPQKPKEVFKFTEQESISTEIWTLVCRLTTLSLCWWSKAMSSAEWGCDLLAQALFTRQWLPTGDRAVPTAQAKGELQINAAENSLCGLLTDSISPPWEHDPDQSLGSSVLFLEGSADLHCAVATVAIPWRPCSGGCCLRVQPLPSRNPLPVTKPALTSHIVLMEKQGTVFECGALLPAMWPWPQQTFWASVSSLVGPTSGDSYHRGLVGVTSEDI